jgi:hypothetical protein
MPLDRLRRAPSSRRGRAPARAAGDLVREGPPPGVGPLRWYGTDVLGRPLAVLHHLERARLTTAVELSADAAEALLDAGGTRLHELLVGLGQSGTPLARLQILASAGRPGQPGRVHLVAALSVTRALAVDAQAADAVVGEGLALIAGRATLDLGLRLADMELSIRGFLDSAELAALIRSRYQPQEPPPAADSPWPVEIDATDHRLLRTTTRQSSWYHATAWVKSWPSTPIGLDLPALLGLPHLRLPRTAAVTAAFDREQGPAVSGYLTVSAPDPAELQQARAELRRALPPDAPLQLEWTDREHHLAFVHTLPLATGLTGEPAAPASRTSGLVAVGRRR